MRALIEKEIRLALPAFAGALALAILPVWLLPYEPWYRDQSPAFFFCFGIVMLALSSFGREIGLNTLSFSLAQPLERSRIWWTKISVLGVFLALAFDAWWLSEDICSIQRPGRWLPPDILALVGVYVAVFSAGAVWLTLLLRQTTAALWFTILIPTAASLAIRALGGTDLILSVILGVCAVAGFFLAKGQFLHVQDTAWTGGVISFSGRRTAEGSDSRKRRPFAALFWKELQLHEFTLAGIAGVFVLHLGAVMLRKLGADSFGKTALSGLEMFGLVWIFVPLLAGSQSVAEERQISTMDGLLCLPVSRRIQFAVKLIFVLVLGGILSATLLCLVEGIGNTIGAGAHMEVLGLTFKWGGISPVFYGFLALCLLGFYASTLTRSVVQALAAGVVTIVVVGMLRALALTHWFINAFGWRLWPVIAYPTLIITITWLAYGNFRWMFESGRRWRRNILTFVTVNLLICGSAAAIYHRVWELAMPLEGPEAPARLARGKSVLVRTSSANGLAAVLPDGRLWVDQLAYLGPGRLAGKGHFAPGSNWLDVVVFNRELMGIQSNGTLWVSEGAGWPRATFVQLGTESNWKGLVRRYSDRHPPFVLLKQDGSLWQLGTNYIGPAYSGLHSSVPQRLRPDSDWARIIRGTYWTYAWKTDGKAWVLHDPETFEDWGDVRVPGLDNVRFKGLITHPTSLTIDVGVRNDGTLCYWEWYKDTWWGNPGARLKPGDLAAPVLVQIGQGSNWVSVTGGFHQVLALRTDGTIWKWNLSQGEGVSDAGLRTPPEQLGTHDDWVALGGWPNASVPLAADGTFWLWPTTDTPSGWRDPEEWLAPSRRLAKIANIFEAGQ